MDISFFIIIPLTTIIILVLVYLKRKKTSVQNLLLSDSDIIFESSDKTVQIVVRQTADEMSSYAEIYIKKRPLKANGQKLSFPLHHFSNNQETVLKKIYFTVTSTDFLQPHFSSRHLGEKILHRIYAMRAQNIRNRITKALQTFDSCLYQKFERQQESEQKMNKILQAQTDLLQKEIEDWRIQNQPETQIPTEQTFDFEKEITDEPLIDVLPQSQKPDIETPESNEIS